MLTADRLRELLHYAPDTGLFTWRKRLRNGAHLRNPSAGHVHSRGRAYLRLDGKNYAAHRLAWLYITGEWPSGEIDHINRDPLDNRWLNLREATRSQNACNMPALSSNKIGLKGVCRPKGRTKYRATIHVDGRKIYLGHSFNTPEEAHAAYCEAAADLHGEFACAR